MNSRKLMAIVRKELSHYFSSVVGYIVLLVYYLLGGFFFYYIATNGREAGLRQIFGTMTFILLFLTPLITMRLWSEEEKNGTAELLKTSPLSLWEIVVGKYLGVLGFFCAMSAPTLVYLVVILVFGNPDLPPLFANYLGYFLAAMLFFSLGLLASTFTENQIVAAAISYCVNLMLWVIQMGGNHMGDSVLGDLLKYMSIFEHTDDFFKGIIDLSHVSFFVSLIFLCLFFSVKVLESKRN